MRIIGSNYLVTQTDEYYYKQLVISIKDEHTAEDQG